MDEAWRSAARAQEQPEPRRDIARSSSGASAKLETRDQAASEQRDDHPSGRELTSSPPGVAELEKDASAEQSNKESNEPSI